MSILNSAHGGEEWRPRAGSHLEEIGSVWSDIGVTSEVGTLRQVLMHRPGDELNGIDDPAPVLWTALIEPELATHQHDMLAETYRKLGVGVRYIEPQHATPNLYFARDLFFMTPQGAIISRMASAVRAGEERQAAAALAHAGVPILMTVYGSGTFEGADIAYLDGGVVLVAFGLRSNREGCRQVSSMLSSIGLQPVIVEMPYGTGHIDGGLSIIDKRKAIIRPYHCPFAAYETLVRLGYELIEVPDEGETAAGMAINLVPVAPGVIVMPAGNPNTRKALEKRGIECHEVDVSELMKGGGAVHCMTGVLKREPI